MRKLFNISALMAFVLLLWFPHNAAASSDNAPHTVYETVGAPSDNSTATTGDGPTKQYHEAWQDVNAYFLWQDKLTDWASWEHRYDGKLNTYADAEKAIGEMLNSLGDQYTYYKTPGKGGAATPRPAPDQTAPGDPHPHFYSDVVTARMLHNGIAYIKINTFLTDHTAADVRSALELLKDAKGFVIDLQGNGGGYIMEAAKVYSLFVDKGTFTTLEGMWNGAKLKETFEITADSIIDRRNTNETKEARLPQLAGNKPVVFLVDGNTASASEMTITAMHAAKRATVIGFKTFGKGIAQITLDLPHGAQVQITYGYWHASDGASIHKTGMTPDKVLDNREGTVGAVDEAEAIIESQLSKN